MLPLFVTMLIPISALGQSANSGKDFWLAFPQNARFERLAGVRFRVFISGTEGTNGIIKEYATGRQTEFTIPASGIAEISIDTSAELTSQGVHKASAHVTASAPVSIVAVSYRPASMDSYCAIPTPQLGHDYAVIGYDSIPGLDHYHTQCDVIAAEDGTSLTLQYPGSVHDAHLIRSSTLERGEVLHLGGDEVHADITGTMIHSNKPVAVITGHTCAQVPANVYYCDLLMEMIPSSDKLGQSFAIAPFKWQVASSIRVVAMEDNTIVKLGGNVVATLTRGSYYQNDAIRQATMLETSHPTYAMQYMHGSDEAHDSYAAADPSMLSLIPIERMPTVIASAIPAIHPGGGTVAPDDQNASWQDLVNIVTRSADLSKLRLNGHSVEASSVVPIAGSDLVVVTIPVRPGKIELSGAPFAAYSYGVGRKENAYESYAMTLGMNLE